MPYQPIEHYGLIGNMRTAALVGKNGSIDWYCFPHFDSPSIFGAILDYEKGGHFQIAPVQNDVRRKQFYWPSTNILITRFLHSSGVIEIEDFMPVGIAAHSPWYHHLFRRVRCVRGSVKTRISCRPAFNYGRTNHKIQMTENGASFISEGITVTLSTKLHLQPDGKGGVSGEFEIHEGESYVLILRGELGASKIECPPTELEAEDLFQSTVRFWHKWLSQCTYRGRWREQVERSALALKLLTFEPTGALIAAPTTSLPEAIGGNRNWDYRYGWARDAAFTVYAFLRLGFRSEAEGFVSWIRNHVAKHIEANKMPPPVYTIFGETQMPEEILSHWEGYQGSGPVRIGNQAVNQTQNDIFGEMLDTIYLYNKYVQPIDYDMWTQLRARLNYVCEIWSQPDHGIWEMRNRNEHFVFSKVMNWVALDRGIRLAAKRSFPSDYEKWLRVRDEIYEEVFLKGWSEERQAFTLFYGSKDLDASLLVMPLCFFISPTDPRMLKTIDAIMTRPQDGGLMRDGLVHRYPSSERIDGLIGEEGSFNMCSFWLVEALTRAGRTMPAKLDQARLLFERILGFANHVGLYAEQTGPQGEALGNFPQAFTHLALISAAFNLDRTLGGRAF